MTRIVPLETGHLDGAARLVAAAAAEARGRHPLLPVGLDNPARVAGMLAGPASGGLGAVALRGREVAGFVAPLIFDLWGKPGAYVPEWGQAAGDPGLVADLYAAVSPRWVEAGRATHAVTVWAHDHAAEAAWHDLGFGRVVVDAVRGLEWPPGRRPRGVTLRRAGPADAGALASLERALWQHLAAAPTCRVHPGPGGRAAAVRRLADPAQPVWVAEAEGQVAGFLSLQPGDESPAALRAAHLVRCDGALVVPGRRNRGVGTALLGTALRWAARAGFTGCVLDFESANVAAARFWTAAGFTPVLHSVARRTS